MATSAFYDGRNSGRLGAHQNQNPYQPDDPKNQEWNKGFWEGQWLFRASEIELFHALKRLRNSVAKLDRLPSGYPDFWL